MRRSESNCRTQQETNRPNKFVAEPRTGGGKIRQRDATGSEFVVDSCAARTGLSQVIGARRGFEKGPRGDRASACPRFRVFGPGCGYGIVRIADIL